MKDTLVKKGFVVSVILLFIGVAIAPNINFNIVKASIDNDLVEVTSQACGINGFGNQTVKLTRQQYQNLEQYLIDFRARLNKTTTREEAVPIFKEAVVELDKYGLLPKGLNVEQAQRLVTGLYQNTKLVKYLEKLSSKSGKSSLQEGNKFCLIYGEAKSYTYFQGLVRRMIYIILYELYNLNWPYNPPIFGLFEFSFFISHIINVYVTVILSNILRYMPYIGATIYYGGKKWISDTYDFTAEGSIWTNGLYGIRNWSGQFYGNLSSHILFGLFSLYYPGVNGFTGLRLYFNHTDFYFGFALRVNVGSEPPYN